MEKREGTGAALACQLVLFVFSPNQVTCSVGLACSGSRAYGKFPMAVLFSSHLCFESRLFAGAHMGAGLYGLLRDQGDR